MPKKPMGNELLVRARRLGKAGFKAGKIAPAQDAECMKMLEGRQVGDTMAMKILVAYHKGWMEEQTKYSDKILKEKGIIIP